MRYIFLASVCTLGLIAGLLALPAVGAPHAQLVEQSAVEKLISSAAGASPKQVVAREFVSPRLELPTADSTPQESLSVSEITTTTSSTTTATPTTTTAPTTSTTTTAPTTSTTTSTTTTTAVPTEPSAELSIDIDDDRGVLISPAGVVLPVVAGGSNGWRAMTPCGNEVTLDRGERVTGADFVLDPGHGGSETGSVGPNGVTEKELNVRIAQIVQWYLEEAGYSVVLTRTSDIRIPLQSRADIANALKPFAFVSIHHNGGATAVQSTPGTEVFVDGLNAEARRLGGLVFEELTNRMARFDADWVGTIHNGVTTRLNDEGDDLYGIHRFTPGIPSVITEAGYLSNASEAELFVDNDVQWAHGRAIADAMVRWRTTSDAGAGFLSDFVDGSSSGTGGFAGCEDPAL